MFKIFMLVFMLLVGIFSAVMFAIMATMVLFPLLQPNVILSWREIKMILPVVAMG